MLKLVGSWAINEMARNDNQQCTARTSRRSVIAVLSMYVYNKCRIEFYERTHIRELGKYWCTVQLFEPPALLLQVKLEEA